MKELAMDVLRLRRRWTDMSLCHLLLAMLAASGCTTLHHSPWTGHVAKHPEQCSNVSVIFVEATPDSGWDLSLYAMSDCNSPGPTCLAGHDGALTERIEFSTGAADDEVFIAVDGANGEAGRFHLSWGPLP